MPGRADLFAQLEALDIPEAGSILPKVDLERIGLVYLLKSAEDRGLPAPNVLRFGSFTVPANVGEFSGMQFTPGPGRCLRIEMLISDLGNWWVKIVARADGHDFTHVDFPDSDFGRSEPDGLTAGSVIEGGHTTGNPHSNNREFYGIQSATNLDRKQMPITDIPPGFRLEVWHQTADQPVQGGLWCREIGP